MEARVGDLAGHHVGLVGVGQCHNDVGVLRASTLEHIGIGGMADDRANVETVLQFTENVGPHVDDGDFVSLLSRQVVGRGRSDLTGA